jgi:hypothetical protein
MLVYAPAIGGEFIYDDKTLIADNPHVHSFHDWKRWFTTDFWDVNEAIKRFGSSLVYWRPLVSASYALDWKIGGGAPVIFHLTNLLWSGACGLLAFFTLRRWIGALLPALLATLLFVVHPTKAETIAWIAGRTDVMCLVTMLLASAGAARRLRGEKHGLALEIAATALSYMIKEQAIVLGAFVGVEAWVALDRPALDRASLVKIVKATLPQFVVGAGYMIVRLKFLPVVRQSGGLPLGAHAQMVLETMGRYLTLALVPHDLSIQEGLIHTSGGNLVFDARYIVVGAIGIVALVALAVAMRRRIPAVTVGVAFYFATLLPTSNVISTSMITMVSERFLFVPTLGLVLAVGGGLAHLAGRPAFKPAALATAAVVAIFAVQTVRRAADFSDEETFWARELALHDDSLEALGFARDHAREKRQYKRALAYAAKGQEVAARYYAHLGWELDFSLAGVELLLQLVPDHPKEPLLAVQRFYATLLDPGAKEANLDVGGIHVSVHFDRAVAARVKSLRPRILTYEAAVASRLGDDATAVTKAQEAITGCTGCREIVRLAALAEARAGRYDLAVAAAEADARVAQEDEPAVRFLREMLARARQAAAASAAAPDGPLKLKLRAEELAALEAWGRAYEVLAPFREQIQTVPELALSFAELAFRAGEQPIAREVLSGLTVGLGTPKVDIDATFREWALGMGWIDAE